jgi:hypothetical protein
VAQARDGGGGRGILMAVIVALAIGLGMGSFATYWFLVPRPLEQASPPPTTVASVAASPSPSATPVPEISASPADPTPSPVASPEAPVSRPAAGGRRREARAAPPAGDGTRPVTPRSEPRPPREPIAPEGGPARRFVLGSTSVESLRPIGADLRGFHNDDVGVKRAPAVSGRLVLEMDPPRVTPGQPYVVRVFLANDGTEGIEVDRLRATTLVDGKRIQVPLTPESRNVGPKARALLRELPGTWKAAVQSWEVEVEVTSKRRDLYRNRLTWK